MLSVSAAGPYSYPTLERVKFVFECMARQGGQSYTSMYGCSCLIDRIADEMSLEDYVYADTYMRLENARGERGGLFRNSSPDARGVRRRFREVLTDATKRCFRMSNEGEPGS